MIKCNNCYYHPFSRFIPDYIVQYVFASLPLRKIQSHTGRLYFCMYFSGGYINSYVLCLLPSKLMLCYFHYCQHFKGTYCKQIVTILIRHRNMRRLVWIYTVCLCPLKRTLCIIGLSILYILVSWRDRA